MEPARRRRDRQHLLDPRKQRPRPVLRTTRPRRRRSSRSPGRRPPRTAALRHPGERRVSRLRRHSAARLRSTRRCGRCYDAIGMAGWATPRSWPSLCASLPARTSQLLHRRDLHRQRAATADADDLHPDHRRRDPRHVRVARRPLRGVHVDQPDRPRARAGRADRGARPLDRRSSRAWRRTCSSVANDRPSRSGRRSAASGSA